MFRSILVCSDGSEPALQAARVAAGLAHQFDSCVHVLNVLDLSILSDPGAVGVWQVAVDQTIVIEELQQAQQAAERNTLMVFQAAHVPAEALRATGHPVECIVEAAQRVKADLIVLGHRGLSGWEALMLGSVADGVAHHAHCPVLIVRGDILQFKKVLLATDGSEGARKATQMAAELARDLDAPLTVLNVCASEEQRVDTLCECSGAKQPKAATSILAQEKFSEKFQVTKAQQSEANKRILPIKQALEAADVAYTWRQEVGHPAKTILRVAEDNGFDLIVMGNRGLGGFQRLLLGSVSDSVAHHAPCSVLIVR